ncbi:aminoglycoside phosphotransferase family protein [Nocardioides stalactiti]|uniref:aminoglycoside phosphotransferase family protein n=1 Tax=Nocardioides stalactiti TaxID=2755356 RepID=UPI00160155D3|nr:aminoglycoside phosphotransferase family protein [Nocardioides stalactiti]
MSLIEKASMLAMAGAVVGGVARERIGPAITLRDLAEVPPTADALTTEWLTAALCGGTPGAAVTSLEITGGSDGTSSRRAIRVEYNAVGRQAGLPTQLFSKAAAGVFSRLLLGLTDITEGEAVFYTRIRGDLDVRSPRAFHAGFDRRTRRSFVLLEDLTSTGWSFPAPMDNTVTREDADAIVEQLASYHAAMWDSPRFRTDLSALKRADRWQADLDRRVGFESRTMRGFDRAVAVMADDLGRRRHELYPAFRRSLELHAEAPPTLLHQDLHLGNWLRDPDGQMGLYDWQCVAVGHWALDLSYALAGCLATENRRAWEEELVRTYCAQLASRGVRTGPSFDEAWTAYRTHPLHALAFGLFTLGGTRFEPELQPRDYTLAAIRRIAAFVSDHATLDLLAR